MYLNYVTLLNKCVLKLARNLFYQHVFLTACSKEYYHGIFDLFSSDMTLVFSLIGVVCGLALIILFMVNCMVVLVKR